MREKPTTLILYISLKRCGQKVWDLVQRQSNHGCVEMYNSMIQLHERLNQISHDDVIAVLFIPDHLELANILRFAQVLHDVKSILVLPDREAETIALGHTLYPRFISFADGDLQDVAAVLDKMLHRFEPQTA